MLDDHSALKLSVDGRTVTAAAAPPESSHRERLRAHSTVGWVTGSHYVEYYIDSWPKEAADGVETCLANLRSERTLSDVA